MLIFIDEVLNNEVIKGLSFIFAFFLKFQRVLEFLLLLSYFVMKVQIVEVLILFVFSAIAQLRGVSFRAVVFLVVAIDLLAFGV
jgi:hypothetical protein